VCSLKLHSCWPFEGGDEINPLRETFFSEYGPGSNTKLIKIDHCITTSARTLRTNLHQFQLLDATRVLQGFDGVFGSELAHH
jgi:hypothetical protein